jgi:drug/metabolite transporter (DMT)-like permease
MITRDIMVMRSMTVKSDALLLTTAIIWGLAFVAQRVGMDYVGPFTFSGIRFAIGSLSLLPLVLMSREQRTATNKILPRPGLKTILFGGTALGLALFGGASLQQIGLVGCGLMLAGMLLSQLWSLVGKTS